MIIISLFRQSILGATTLFSLIVLSVSAHLISQTVQYFDATATFCALGAAVAVISLMTLPVMLVVDILRRGAFISTIAVELVWLSILWILWVAAAGETVSGYNTSFTFGCNYVNSIYNDMCHETRAIAAFSFLNFVIILLYIFFLVVMAMNAANRGQSIWLMSVRECFGSPAGMVQHPMSQYSASQPAV